MTRPPARISKSNYLCRRCDTRISRRANEKCTDASRATLRPPAATAAPIQSANSIASSRPVAIATARSLSLSRVSFLHTSESGARFAPHSAVPIRPFPNKQLQRNTHPCDSTPAPNRGGRQVPEKRWLLSMVREPGNLHITPPRTRRGGGSIEAKKRDDDAPGCSQEVQAFDKQREERHVCLPRRPYPATHRR